MQIREQLVLDTCMSTSTASSFVLGYGSTLKYAPIASGTVGTYIKIGQTVDLSTPEMSIGKVSVTNNDSPNNSKEYAPGMIDPGEVSYDLVYAKTLHESVFALAGNGIVYSFQETFPDTSTATFTGYFSKVSVEGKTEDSAIMGKVSVQATSAVVYA